MGKSELNDKDKKVMAIILIIGFIVECFIDSAMDIALLCFYMYINHRYIGTTENIKEYDNYEFSDKVRYDKGRKLFVWLVDIYIVIRIIFILLNKQSAFVFGEMILITIIYNLYEKYLEKKYVISTNILEENKIVFARRKILLIIGIIVFIVFSQGTIDRLKRVSTQDYVKYSKYEYNLSNIEDKRKIEVKAGSNYMMTEENDGNSEYFDTFIQDTKSLIKKQVLKNYLFISTVFFITLGFMEVYSKCENIISKAGNILFIIALVFSIFSFNIDTNKAEMDLSLYFHEYMNR